jgi:outer membrane protein TolC
MRKYIYIISGFMMLSVAAHAQQDSATLPDGATVSDCVDYALKHYPGLQASYVNQEITNSQIKTRIADWYPQIAANAAGQHYFQVPQTISGGMVVPAAVVNTAGVNFGLTQNIFNRDALLASQTKNNVLQVAKQNTELTKIDVIANVRKAFYAVLLTKEQIKVLQEDIIRLQKSLHDAKSQYDAQIVDNTDYKRATISLNSSVAQQRAAQQLLDAKYATLKQLMGYPAAAPLSLQAADSVDLEQQAMFDTATTVNPQNRVELQQLQTEQALNQANLKYEKWSYIPTVSAFANYNLAYMNNNSFWKMFNNNYPNSYVGIQLGLPIFQGWKRTENIRIAKFQIDLNTLNQTDLTNSISAEYQNALSIYKGDLITYETLKTNVELAKQVYNTIALQYQSSYKSYLDVTNAETDLRTAEINYANALYQLIVDKVDVEKSLGLIQ